MREEVENDLLEKGVETVVLSKIFGAEQSLFQKFLRWGRKAQFAVVLFSADDLGAARLQYEQENVGDKALKFRARQNVILELGFFYGRLGWANVFALLKPPAEVYPDFELPSDLAGILFDRTDPEGEWKSLLEKRLAAAGFSLRNETKSN